MDIVEQLRQEAEPIFDAPDYGAQWNDAWEDWARRALALADKAEALGFPGGAAGMREMVEEIKRKQIERERHSLKMRRWELALALIAVVVAGILVGVAFYAQATFFET